MDHYSKMLNKVNEVGDLYRRANSEILSMMGQMIEQDAKFRDDFINGLVADPALVQNLEILGMIPRGDQRRRTSFIELEDDETSPDRTY